MCPFCLCFRRQYLVPWRRITPNDATDRLAEDKKRPMKIFDITAFPLSLLEIVHKTATMSEVTTIAFMIQPTPPALLSPIYRSSPSPPTDFQRHLLMSPCSQTTSPWTIRISTHPFHLLITTGTTMQEACKEHYLLIDPSHAVSKVSTAVNNIHSIQPTFL